MSFACLPPGGYIWLRKLYQTRDMGCNAMWPKGLAARGFECQQSVFIDF